MINHFSEKQTNYKTGNICYKTMDISYSEQTKNEMYLNIKK